MIARAVGARVIAVDRHAGALDAAKALGAEHVLVAGPAADYPEMLALIASGALRPQDLIERVTGLSEAAALLPAFDKASPAGMTMIDPRIA